MIVLERRRMTEWAAVLAEVLADNRVLGALLRARSAALEIEAVDGPELVVFWQEIGHAINETSRVSPAFARLVGELAAHQQSLRPPKVVGRKVGESRPGARRDPLDEAEAAAAAALRDAGAGYPAIARELGYPLPYSEAGRGWARRRVERGRSGPKNPDEAKSSPLVRPYRRRMKVRMHSAAAGPAWAANSGEVIELDEAEGAQLVAARYAIAVSNDTPVDRRPFAADESDDSDDAAWTSGPDAA